jgi:hypothetical protein
MRVRLFAIPFILAACAGPVPDSNPEPVRGPAFGSVDAYAAERARRDAELSGMGQGFDPEARAIAQETLTVLNSRPDPLTGTIDPGTGQIIDNLDDDGISDEQDFAAVSDRRTIENDAARIAQATAAYEVIQPTAIPTRDTSNDAPNVVAFALETTNRPGQAIYDRSGLFSESRYDRACARYTSAAKAQEAFLAAGGPERDRSGMDPDGDGFACLWDPTPYRAARGG